MRKKRNDIMTSPLDDPWYWMIVRFRTNMEYEAEKKELRRKFNDTMVLPEKILTHEGMELPLAMASNRLWFFECEFEYEKTEKQLEEEQAKLASKLQARLC